jgi:glycosyltransferase involved in cell wall biosynthesis
LANYLAERTNVRIIHIGNPDLIHSPLFLHRLHRGVQVVPLQVPLKKSSIFDLFRRFVPHLTSGCIVQMGSYDDEKGRLLLALRPLVRKLVVMVHSPFVHPLPPKTSRRYLWGSVSGLGLWWYKLQIRRFLLPAYLPTVTVCVSNAVKSALEHAGKIHWPNCRVIHNGVDVHRFQYSLADRLAVRRAWGFDDSIFLFGYVGRLAPEKGCRRLLDAFAHYVATTCDRLARLVFVGDGPEREEIERAVAVLGLEGVVRVVGAFDDVSAIYSALDCFVLVSDFEGLPLSLLEAMSCSRLCIARDVGGVTEALTDSDGIVVPREGGVETITAALRRARTLPDEQRKHFEDRCRHRIEVHFNLVKQLEQLGRIVL